MRVSLTNITNYISAQFSEIGSDRLVKVALPFLRFNKTTASLASIGINVHEFYHSRDILVIASAAFDILFPTEKFLLSTATFTVVQLEKLQIHFKNYEWDECATIILQIAQKALYITSYFYHTPYLFVASLASQTATELYEGLTQGKLELIAALILVSLRLRKEYQYVTVEKKPVVLCITSPYDSNGALKLTKNLFFESLKDNKKLSIIETTPRDLHELQRTINDHQLTPRRVNHIIFNCHGVPIAIKPTSYIIRMPTDSQFANHYFIHHSEMQRAPDPSEYESFDNLVQIIKSCISLRGRVTFLSCSTAVSVDHPENNFTEALARRLPGIKVFGTTNNFEIDEFLKSYSLSFTANGLKIQYTRLKRYFYPIS